VRRALIGGVVGTAALVLGPVALAGAAPGGAFVTGSGNTYVNGFYRTFTVDARTAPDGTVSGQAEVQARETDDTVHLAVNCLVVDGNVAYLSGVVTQSTEDPSLIGNTSNFTVEDDSPDMISLATRSSSGPCSDSGNRQAPSLTVAHGNITIHS